MAFVQHLEQNVEDVRVRFLDFIQQDHGVGLPPHRLGQRSRVLIADVARRGADQPRDGELLHVLRHVDPDEGRGIGKEELGQRSGQLGLSDPGRAGEDEGANGTVRILESGPRTADGPGHRLDGLILADDRAVQLVFHPHEPGGLGFLQPGDGNAGPAGDDEGDGLLVDHRPLGLPLPLPLLVLEPDLILQIALLVAEGSGALEVLIPDRVFLLDVHLFQGRLQLGHLGGWNLRREPRPGPGLVDHVDRLIRQEPVGDVPLRQLGRGGQGQVWNADAVMILVLLPQAL